MRIQIGISAARCKDPYGFEFHGERQVLRAAVQAGLDRADVDAAVFILPLVDDDRAIQRSFDALDAIILPGGVDVTPCHYAECDSPGLRETDPLDDRFEVKLARLALTNRKPILGICRGMQLMAISRGATLIQDLETELGSGSAHHDYRPRVRKEQGLIVGYHDLIHDIDVEPGSHLQRCLQLGGLSPEQVRLRTNSVHHQAVDPADLPRVWRVTARDPSDGVIEAIEHSDHPFAVGVQWHPEFDFERDKDSVYVGLFSGLAFAAAEYATQRES